MPVRRLLALSITVTVTLLAPVGVPEAHGTETTDVAAVTADADWILTAQFPDGAIAHYVDRVKVWPYLSNFAAMGLARATEVSGNAIYVNAAWRWLSWYQSHQDSRGFVTDYDAVNGTLVSTGTMDSTDAYAGTFLLAVWRTYAADGNRRRLLSLHRGLVGAVAAIEATQDADGLTWAKPSWPVKYLMDQAETYAGLRAAAELAKVLGDAGLQWRATADADRMAAGVERLSNPTTGAYDWAVHANGFRQPTNWSVFYPDAQQQMWAVAFGLVPGSRARALVSTFDSMQPSWDRPTALARYDSGWAPVGYWPVTGWAYAAVGGTARSFRAAYRIRGAATAANRAWPFTPAIAGQLIQLRSGDRLAVPTGMAGSTA